MRMPMIAALAFVAASAPAHAQQGGMEHGDHMMMDHAAHQAAPDAAQSQNEGHDMHMGHDMSEMSDSTQHDAHAPSSDADTVGNAPAPSAPADHAADRIFDRSRMATARAMLAKEGKFFGNAVIVDQLEYRAVKGRNGYGWDAEAWIGSDIDRLVIASEGEGAFGGPAERTEVRAMLRHAVSPYFNLEAGVRHDFHPDPQRTYAAVGMAGIAPYWFDVEGQVLVSNKGDIHARIEGSYDLRITNRLILQPAAEVDVAFQDVPELGVGAGFDRIETGLRLRYHVSREVAPYVGVNWERKLGDSARYARLSGDDASSVSAVVGLRLWF